LVIVIANILALEGGGRKGRKEEKQGGREGGREGRGGKRKEESYHLDRILPDREDFHCVYKLLLPYTQVTLRKMAIL
jgi:hypothetical protein